MSEEIATVQDLIEHLEKNFNPEDKMCFWHEGGAWIACEHVHKSEIGTWMLYRVKDEKARRMRSNNDADASSVEHDYCLVKDEDVVIW